MVFAKYSYKQLKWVIIEKLEMRNAYFRGELYGDYLSVIDEVNEFSKDYIMVINGDA